jgi:probable selenium-dependent hydroxylase accessory protein YqeC
MISLRKALRLEGRGVISLVGAGGKSSLMYRLAQELSNDGDSVLTTTTTKIIEPAEDQSPSVILSESLDTIVEIAKGRLTRGLHLTAAAARSQKGAKLIGLKPGIIDAIATKRIFRWIIVEADGAAGRPLKAPADHEPVIPAMSRWIVGLAGLSGIGKPLNSAWVFRPERFARIAGIAMEESISAEAISNVLRHEQGTFKNSPENALRIVFLNQSDVCGGIKSGRQIASLLQRKPSRFNGAVIGQVLRQQPVLQKYTIGDREVYDA